VQITDSVVAYSLPGKKLWSVQGADVCAVGGGYAVVQVNQQLATLDVLSGEQVNFNADADCDGTVVPPYLIREGTEHAELFRILPQCDQAGPPQVSGHAVAVPKGVRALSV